MTVQGFQVPVSYVTCSGLVNFLHDVANSHLTRFRRRSVRRQSQHVKRKVVIFPTAQPEAETVWRSHQLDLPA